MLKRTVFGKRESLAMKGIAILMMLLFHCFREQTVYDGFEVIFFPFRETTVVNIAYTCKICVSLFAFVSGYGLYKNYSGETVDSKKWFISRYVKSFSGYWFVWVLCAIVFQIFDGRYITTYGKGITGFIYSLVDFCGLATIFKTPTLNANWWYMSAAFVFIMLMPIIYKCKEYIWLLLISEIVFIRILPSGSFTGHNSVYAFLFAYLCGCLFAKDDLINKWVLIERKSLLTKVYKGIAEIWIIMLLYKGYLSLQIEQLWEYHYGLFPVAVILFCAEFVISYTKSILCFLGRHSANIYLTHTFIRLYYFRDFTYSWKHFALIILILLLVSLIISFAIEALKKTVRYDKLIAKIIKCIVT